MPSQRAKILTRFTVPAGGWTLDIYYSDAVQFDTKVQATVAAGDYYVAWDNQSDDFLWSLAKVVNVAVDAAAMTGWIGRVQGVVLWIDDDHKVNLGFDGSWFADATHREVRIDWTAEDGADIAAALGFDSSTTLDLTGTDNPTATADWHHAYGWYCDKDGETEDLRIEDTDNPAAAQTFGPGGHSKAQYIGSRFTNQLRLQFVPRKRMHSADVGYTATPQYPYEKNQPLQCWFKKARQGTEFRVYRYNHLDTSVAGERGSRTTSTNQSLTDTGKAWDTDPQEFAGAILHIANQAVSAVWPMRAYVSSNTATVLTLANINEPQLTTDPLDNGYWVFDQRYGTYVLDINAMGRFLPRERKPLDLFDIVIPLSRYET